MGKVITDDRSLPARAGLVVIGAGIVGAATAFYATRAGLSTVVLEKREQPGMLTTAVSSECIREQWRQPHNIAMMRESMDIIERFAGVVGLPGYDVSLHQQGYLYLTADPARVASFERLVALQRQNGLQGIELLDGNEARRRFPWLAPAVLAARYNKRDGWLAVHELLWGFIKGSNAAYIMNTPVTAIDIDRRGVCAVATERGRIATRRVVIAAGPFSAHVAALAGVDLPLVNERHQETRLARPGVCPPDAPMVVDEDTHVYWRPDGPAALLGGGEEGVCPAEPVEHVPADWEFPALALDKAMRLSPFWADVCDSLRAEDVFVNAGQYSFVADRCPVIGATPVPGLFLNAAYDGHGIMGAPAGSRLLVDLITGRAPAAGNPFAIERLSSGHGLAVEDAIL